MIIFPAICILIQALPAPIEPPPDVDPTCIHQVFDALTALDNAGDKISTQIRACGPAVQRWSGVESDFPASRLDDFESQIPGEEYTARTIEWERCQRMCRVSLLGKEADAAAPLVLHFNGNFWYTLATNAPAEVSLDINRSANPDFSEIKLIGLFNGDISYPSAITSSGLNTHLKQLACVRTATSDHDVVAEWRGSDSMWIHSIRVQLDKPACGCAAFRTRSTVSQTHRNLSFRLAKRC